MTPREILENLMLKVEKMATDDESVDELNVFQEAIIRLENNINSKLWMDASFFLDS